jgi:hypothetical protein
MDRETVEKDLALVDKILNANPDDIAYYASGPERFYFIIDCKRAIRALQHALSEAHSTNFKR